MASRRQTLLAQIQARLQAITRGNGFQTDAGDAVFLNESPVLGPDDPPEAIAVMVGEDVPVWVGENVHVTVPIEIQGLANADLEAPWITAEAVVADIKQAMELEDRRFGGLLAGRMERGSTRVVEREEGQTTVGVSVEYLFPVSEAWGDP